MSSTFPCRRSRPIRRWSSGAKRSALLRHDRCMIVLILCLLMTPFTSSYHSRLRPVFTTLRSLLIQSHPPARSRTIPFGHLGNDSTDIVTFFVTVYHYPHLLKLLYPQQRDPSVYARILNGPCMSYQRRSWGSVSKNSLIRFKVTLDGFASGRSDIIHCSRVARDFLSATTIQVC